MSECLMQDVVCPRCGQGTLSPQMVEETIAVGHNAVQVKIQADVCSFCGEHWFGPAATAEIDAAIKQLREGDLSQLKRIGELYSIP